MNQNIISSCENMTISLHFSEDPIWFGLVSQRNMDFCKASHWSVCSKFCHSNVRGFHRHITFTTHRLANLSNFMHTIPTKIDPDNLKGCQICNGHINYNLHNIKVCHLSQRGIIDHNYLLYHNNLRSQIHVFVYILILPSIFEVNTPK